MSDPGAPMTERKTETAGRSPGANTAGSREPGAGEKDRLLAAFRQIGQSVLGSLDLERVLDELARLVIEVGIFRSLMIALVHRESRSVEVVRNYVCINEVGEVIPGRGMRSSQRVLSQRADGTQIVTDRQIIGTRYGLDEENITPEVARTGRLAVIEGWSDKFDENAGDRDSGRSGHVSYFIPVKKGEQVLAVLATGSRVEEKEDLLQRIEVMQPLLDQVAIALDHAHLYSEMQKEIAERRGIEERLKRDLLLREAEGGVRLAIAAMYRPEDLFGVVSEIDRQLDMLEVKHSSVSIQIVDPEGPHFFSVGKSVNSRVLGWLEAIEGPWEGLPDNGEKYPWVIEVWRTRIPLYQPNLPEEFDNLAGCSVIDVPFSRGTLAINSRESHAFREEEVMQILEPLAHVLSEGFRRFVDIVERTRAERALADERNRLRTLIDALPNTIYIKDAQSRFVVGNRAVAHIMGVQSPEELLGKTDFDFYPRELAESYFADEQEILRTGRALIEKEEPLIDPEGNHLVFLTSKVPLRDSEGRIVGLVGTGQNITERRRLARELVRSQRLGAVGELAAGISHNLNNILTTILGPAQLIGRLSGEPEVLREAAEIVASSRRARDLVQRLHQSVRGVEDRLTSVQVDPVVREVVSATRPRWKDEPESKGNSIEVVTLLAASMPVRATATGLYDILTNLMFNAVDAMDRGGKIRIATSIEGEWAVVAFEDTGIGMDEETCRRVFEPFFTTKMNVGTGLGLSTAHGMIESWGGRIEVESAPGRGTVFTLHLPVWKEGEMEEEEPHSVPDGARGRLLVVEDDEQVRRVLVRTLGERHRVEEVVGGREGLERFDNGPFDAVLIDLGMPGLSGDRVAQEMKRSDPAVATVLISGCSLEADDPRLASFDFYLKKPFVDLEEVEKIVARAVELTQERREGGDRC